MFEITSDCKNFNIANTNKQRQEIDKKDIKDSDKL